LAVWSTSAPAIGPLGGGNGRAAPPPAPPRFDRREQSLELGVFLLLIVPSMVLGLFVVRRGGLGFPIVAWATILRDLGLACLVGFLAWRNGEPLGRLGWPSLGGSWPRVGREVALGLALFLPIAWGAAVLDRSLQAIGFSAPATPMPNLLPGSGSGQLALAVLLVSVVAVTEETIFRGYLILRFSAITRRTGAAIALSALVFGIGHGYEGSSGVITVGAMGVVLGALYVWRGSLVAPMVIHFLQDFAGIVLLPLLRR
jgi:membrane protease YdiL (CAAX protease family)